MTPTHTRAISLISMSCSGNASRGVALLPSLLWTVTLTDRRKRSHAASRASVTGLVKRAHGSLYIKGWLSQA